jgi:DNA-binding NarL/FixJ family response regulator
MLAYATRCLWITTVFFNPVFFGQYQIDLIWSATGYVFFISLLSFTVSLALLGCFYRFTLRLFGYRLGQWVGPVCAGLGLLLVAPDIAYGVAPDIRMLILGSLGTGFGSALVLLDIGRSYSVVERRECALEVFSATALAAVLALSVCFMPFPLVLCFCLLLPFVTILCVRKSHGLIRKAPSKRRLQGEKLSRKKTTRFILAAVVLGVITSFMHKAYSLNNANPLEFQHTLLVSIGILITAIIVGAIVLLSKSFSIGTIYKPALLLCVVGYTIIPAFGAGGFPPFLIVSIGFTFFEALVWIVLSELANRFQYISVQVFGIGRALVSTIELLVAIFFSSVLAGIDIFDARILALISAVAITLIVFTLAYILPDRVLETFENDARPACNSPLQQNDESTKQKVPLLARCQLIGQFYRLSPRETEIFHLLACGRNTTRIQEELVIAAGTANTHLRHIYQKLGVHTQQEVIDLMQAADLDRIAEDLAKSSDKASRSRRS